jgi:predicted DNA-binding transcriptional regulator AlpA
MRKVLSHADTLVAVGNPDRKTVNNWVKKNLFPEPVQIGPNRIGWYADEVDEWLENRPRGFLRPLTEKIMATDEGAEAAA